MFLALLNDSQKKLFFSLACNLVVADGVFSESERMVLEGYSTEMGVRFKMEDADTDVDRILLELNKDAGSREKKIIIFEIIGLAMADYDYDASERVIVNKALQVFGIEPEFGDFCEQKIAEYLKLQGELNSKILS